MWTEILRKACCKMDLRRKVFSKEQGTYVWAVFI